MKRNDNSKIRKEESEEKMWLLRHSGGNICDYCVLVWREHQKNPNLIIPYINEQFIHLL